MVPMVKLGRGRKIRRWGLFFLHANHSNYMTRWDHNKLKISIGLIKMQKSVESWKNCLYRWLGYACWQWCLWPHWWLHTPILHGPPCWGTKTVSCHWVGCCAYSCSASPPAVDMKSTQVRSGGHANMFQNLLILADSACCVFVYCTFLQVMVGISGSPEAAQGITSSLPASWRYSPPGLTLK